MVTRCFTADGYGNSCSFVRLVFLIQSNHALLTPHYYRQFGLSLGKESPYIFSKFNPLNTDTSLLRTVWFVSGERKPLHFL